MMGLPQGLADYNLIWPVLFFVKRVLLEHSHTHLLTFCEVAFLLQQDQMVVRDHVVHKVENIYSLALYRSLPTRDLDRSFGVC